MDISSHDVLLVGGGGAGLRAAIAVSEFNPNLSVAVVSKVYPMRSHTVSAEGGAAGVIKPGDTLDEHAYDTISGGDWMCDQDAVELFVQDAPRELLQLEHWGCPWSREPDGRVAVRPFGGMKKERTWFAADKTGFHMLHTLFQTSLKYQAVTRYDEWFVTKLLVDNGQARGVVAVELMTGRIQAILDGDHAARLAVVNQQFGNEPFVVARDRLVFERGLEEGMEHVEAGLVGGEPRALFLHPAEGTHRDAAVRLAAPRAAPVFELQQFPRRILDEQFDRVLVAHPISAGDRVVSVFVQSVAGLDHAGGAAFG